MDLDNKNVDYQHHSIHSPYVVEVDYLLNVYVQIISNNQIDDNERTVTEFKCIH
jgi:hypothetical protein